MNKSLMAELANVEKIVGGFAAQREPEENKLTTIMPPGVELTCYQRDAGLNTSGERIVFCVSDSMNVAGYYLGWRETRGSSGMPRRREWACSKNRDMLIRMADRRAEKFPANCKKMKQRRIERIKAANAPAAPEKAAKTLKAAALPKTAALVKRTAKPIPKPKAKVKK